jgi:hypothetical protein
MAWVDALEVVTTSLPELESASSTESIWSQFTKDTTPTMQGGVDVGKQFSAATSSGLSAQDRLAGRLRGVRIGSTGQIGTWRGGKRKFETLMKDAGETLVWHADVDTQHRRKGSTTANYSMASLPNGRARKPGPAYSIERTSDEISDQGQGVDDVVSHSYREGVENPNSAYSVNSNDTSKTATVATALSATGNAAATVSAVASAATQQPSLLKQVGTVGTTLKDAIEIMAGAKTDSSGHIVKRKIAARPGAVNLGQEIKAGTTSGLKHLQRSAMNALHTVQSGLSEPHGQQRQHLF